MSVFCHIEKAKIAIASKGLITYQKGSDVQNGAFLLSLKIRCIFDVSKQR
jgi:hypothetical protein